MQLLILRTIFIYFTILVFVRIMGKREIGQLDPFDFVVAIMIAELAVLSIEDEQTALILGLAPIIILVLLEIFIAYLSLKSNYIRGLITGKPSILIEKSKINYPNLKKSRYNLNDLLLQLRLKDIFNIDDVELAILETSGELSVVKKGKNKYHFPVILDGEYSRNLEIAGVNQDWLDKYLQDNNLDLKKIFLATIDNNKQLKIYNK